MIMVQPSIAGLSCDSGKSAVGGFVMRSRDTLGRFMEGEVVDPKVRFWAKVDKDGPNGCWIWKGATTNEGYGEFWVVDRVVRAHRYAYELIIEPIPEGMTIDHLCRNTSCVNPEHMEVVTGHQNILRGEAPTALNARATHCIHGHPFDILNTYYPPRGGRQCRICRSLRHTAREGG